MSAKTLHRWKNTPQLLCVHSLDQRTNKRVMLGGQTFGEKLTISTKAGPNSTLTTRLITGLLMMSLHIILICSQGRCTMKDKIFWGFVFCLGILMMMAGIGWLENPHNNLITGIIIMYSGTFVLFVGAIKIARRERKHGRVNIR